MTALLIVLATAFADSSDGRAPALTIQEGSLARSQVVAVGRDLVVAGEALSDVAAVAGSVQVSGSVGGDLIVLGGDAFLAPSARVEGDVFVLGGILDASPGAVLGGRAVSYASVSEAWLTLLEGPSLGLSPGAPVVLGAKLSLLAAWVTLSLALLAVSGREVLQTSQAVAAEPFRSFTVGLTAVLAMVLTALFFSAFATSLVGIPLLLLVVGLAIVLKLWGVVSVFHATGDWLATLLLRRRLAALAAATLGLVVLGALKLVPFLGTIIWTAVTLIGVGAALTTKMGRREPWLKGDTARAWPG